MKQSINKAALAAATENDPRWASVQARDATADGDFYYSVKTTGVYCRPSCAARQARPENVRFHASCEAAELAGFRPCKRCKPRQPLLASEHAARITEACRLIESADPAPKLAELADTVGISRFHFHRLFKSVTGLTPRQYAHAHRAERVRKELDHRESSTRANSAGASITRAIFDAGYNANSRFYEESDRVLGMRPREFLAGGIDVDIRFAIGECSLGSILVAQSVRGICAILLGDDPDVLACDLQARFPGANIIGGDHDFEQLIARVVGLIESPAIGLDLPLDIRGTSFQQRVWQALRDIPAGETASYTDIAKRIGSPRSVRAVAQACAANALAVAIPCHRVVRIDGGLSGYRWGVERKRALLEKEAKQ
ncbi:bifunctional DNA-binding transcriptional regulator/O6-methylguanine-DNA methyltransferase Ada [Chitinimonas arctica]|uniref:Bifunctional DNA-binding transcriptional regulator/O6-methylguanine-DNA methyltransferase Ada n=1 Tax=Chitinimonas arctica TaxID=2594795 RepID=A0A516SL32_9NEIS|nr:bifunctional DNA-binding transcriptional regulator/O6-methylguanine-DNA methyltransferase Ada [Chitinimonas arctica]QDQ28864.1 bifunctional DNA-binding transcriptional regulator/O6-methylguanine-DNA methyltransferase Ada [Chitinimonas arctica]